MSSVQHPIYPTKNQYPRSQKKNKKIQDVQNHLLLFIPKEDKK